MRGPSAFDHIHHEHDPAWHGHAAVEARPWWRSPVAVAAAAVIAAAIFLTAVVVRGDDPASGESAAQASSSPATRIAGTSALPVVAPTPGAGDASTSLPVVDAAAQLPTGDVMLSATMPPSTPKHDLWAGAAWSYTSPASPTGLPGSLLTGDTLGLEPGLAASLQQVAAALGTPIEVVSGLRTRAEQAELYRRYAAGAGNLAAVPGTSRHESGTAADVYVGGVALADVPGAALLAQLAGLGFPVAGEPWHVERIAPR